MMFTHDLQIVYVVWFSLMSPPQSLYLPLSLSISSLSPSAAVHSQLTADSNGTAAAASRRVCLAASPCLAIFVKHLSSGGRQAGSGNCIMLAKPGKEFA